MATMPNTGRAATRRRALATLHTPADAPRRAFMGFRCAWCFTGLHDAQGNPRWEIAGRMTFVCAGGCP